MNLLAFELSTRRGSVALFVDDVCSAEETWDEKKPRNEEALARLPQLLERGGVCFQDLDAYAAGRGPGIYSGMRIALTVAQGLALPDQKKVYAVSSGAALAHAVAREHPNVPVAVVGDARRQQLWVGLFEPAEVGLAQTLDWTLTSADHLSMLLPESAVMVTSEWERLEPAVSGHSGWIRSSCYPSARTVGELTLHRCRCGRESEPLTPLYMQPAV